MNQHQDVIRVIALDFDNAVRSQMAEAFLRKIGDGRLEVCSGGIDPRPVHPLTAAVMSEIGYDLTGQEPKSAQRFFGKEAFQVAILVARPDEPQCPRLFPGALRIERWPNEDPLADEVDETRLLERFRAVRDRIKAQAEAWWKALKQAETGVFSPKRLDAAGH